MSAPLTARIYGKSQRVSSRVLFRRPIEMRNERPIVSFTFDDFPRSALQTGGAILQDVGVAGTYYAAFGLMGRQAPTGTMFVAEDLRRALDDRHEVGCHTYAHCDAWATGARDFETSVIANASALATLVPDASFRTLSYPIAPPWPLTKRRVAKRFLCGRGSGQTLNVGVVDLNNVHAFFLEQARGDLAAVRALIERNRRERGWLVFATHDVAETPTPYGCTPAFFKAVVQSAVNSGALIVPVAKAVETIAGDATVALQWRVRSEAC
jgi:peptidoglycan/xylan/chitin deacetylase (PgdA/CDA1 family)